MPQEFTAVLAKPGIVVDGVALTEEALKACAGADVAVLDAGNNPIPGATAKVSWDEEQKVLYCQTTFPDGMDPSQAHAELLLLTKAAQGIKDLADGVGRQIMDGHDRKVNDIDDSIPYETVDIWYDLIQWLRFVKTRYKQDKPASIIGSGNEWGYMYAVMSCVEEGNAFMTEVQYETAMKAAKAGRCFAKVKRPLHKDSLFAENKLIGLMQKVYDAEPMAQGHRILLPPVHADEFEVSA